jgi:hypothetical protein
LLCYTTGRISYRTTGRLWSRLATAGQVMANDQTFNPAAVLVWSTIVRVASYPKLATHPGDQWLIPDPVATMYALHQKTVFGHTLVPSIILTGSNTEGPIQFVITEPKGGPEPLIAALLSVGVHQIPPPDGDEPSFKLHLPD